MSATIPTAAFVKAIWQPGDVREVRILKYDGFNTAAGYFDDPELLIGQVDQWDGKGQVYLTLNPVKRALLSRYPANMIKPKAKDTTSDKDVIERRWLLVDLDPERPTDVSASEEEREATHTRAQEVYLYLHEQGWPAPLSGMTGNGYALLYPVALPNDDDSRRLVEGILAHLAAKFTDDVVKIDTSVANAARIGRLFGTLNVKGQDTTERPHRRSELLTVPDELLPVPLERLKALVPATNGHAPAMGSSGTLKARLDAKGISYHREVERDGAHWYLLEECPVHPGEDLRSDCGPGETASGMLLFKCFHDRGTAWRWQDYKKAAGLTGPQVAIAGVTDVPARAPRPAPRFYTPRELATLTLPTPDWLIPGILAVSAITEIDGKIKAAGKTTLSLFAVRAVLDGAPFLGWPTRRARVLYATEQQRQTFMDALRRTGLAERGEELRILFREDLRGLKWPEVVALLQEEAVTGNRDLVVIDTIGKLAGIVNENDAGEWSAAMSPVQDLAASGRAVLLDRHDRKSGGEVGESGRGSSQASGDVDIILGLRRPEGKQPGSRRVIESLSRYPDTPEKIVIELHADGYVLLGEEEAVATSDARVFVLAALGRENRQHNGMEQKELTEEGAAHTPKLTRWAIREALDALIGEQKITTTGKARSRKDPLTYHLESVGGTPSIGVPPTRSEGTAEGLTETEFQLLLDAIPGAEEIVQ
jgi:hypothetical protein